jgi:predicted Ser/Thr protein kinase
MKTNNGIYIPLSTAGKVKKPNGTVLALKNYKKSLTYNKTNLVHPKSMHPIVKKNGKYFVAKPNGTFTEINANTKVQKPNKTIVAIKNLTGPSTAGPSTAGPSNVGTKIYKKGSHYTKTNLVHASSKWSVYKKNGVNTYYTFSPTGEFKMIPIHTKVQKPNGTQLTIKEHKTAAFSAPAPAPVSAVVTVSVPVPVAVSKPVASHTLKASKFTKIAQLLKLVAKRKKEALAKKPAFNARTAYCANKNKGFAYINRTNSIKFMYTGCHGMGGDYRPWENNLDGVKFIQKNHSFSIQYNQYQFAKQLEYLYYPPPKNFSGVNMNQIIDMEWFQAQNKFLKTLGPREVFLMYGYSFNGDSWAHAYLDGRFDLSQFQTGVTSAANQGRFFAFFFQARDIYKINTGNIRNDYKEVVKRVRTEKDVQVIKTMAQMFIDELNALIERAPVTKRAFTVFRGVKDDRYMSGIQNKQYVLNRFCSTSVSGMKAHAFATPVGNQTHTLQRILIMPGSKCLLMFGFTRFEDEFEILLPRGTAYIIRNVKDNVAELAGHNMCNLTKLSSGFYHQIKHIPDIICLGMTKKYTSIKKTIHVPVPVVLTNLNKAQKFVPTVKLTKKIGAGGYGSVFQGVNKHGRNVAVKFQAKSINSLREALSLYKLKKIGGIAPNMYNSKNIPWNKNFASLVPKGLKQGETGAVTITELIKGKPLKNYMTGPPLNPALKQKIANKVAALHKAGIIHGDLHRNNIIINNKGEPWLIDFGKSLNLPSGKNANEYVKGFGHGSVTKYGKTFWYSNAGKTRSHQANGNFLKRLI